MYNQGKFDQTRAYYCFYCSITCLYDAFDCLAFVIILIVMSTLSTFIPARRTASNVTRWATTVSSCMLGINSSLFYRKPPSTEALPSDNTSTSFITDDKSLYLYCLRAVQQRSIKRCVGFLKLMELLFKDRLGFYTQTRMLLFGTIGHRCSDSFLFVQIYQQVSTSYQSSPNL